MNSKIIDNALDFVKQVFSTDFSGHDYFHTLRVYKMAVKIGLVFENVNAAPRLMLAIL